ncbi:MAG TPA: hypothetical protein VFR11_10050 [Micromonosporaceae bacterium]|nr:hypothetical protein [Micromonosporaceae bacterium]
MIQRSISSKLLGPAGLVLAGVGLLLPFGAVSCQAENNTASLTYSGVDLIRDGGGTLSTNFGFPPTDATGETVPVAYGPTFLHAVDTTSIRTLLITVVALLLVGALTPLVRPPVARATILAGVACSAAVLLVASQISGRHAVINWFALNQPVLGAADGDHGLPSGIVVQPSVGFWLSLALVVVVGAGNIWAILRATRRPQQFDALVLAQSDG